MASTRNRRNGQASTTSTATAADISATDNTPTTRSLRSTRSNTTRNGANNNHNQVHDEDDGDNNGKGNDLATPLATNTENITSQSSFSSLLTSTVLTESTTTIRKRGARLGTQTNYPNDTTTTTTTTRSARHGKKSASTATATSIAAVSRSDSESEVEMPRREVLKAVVLIDRSSIDTNNIRNSLLNNKAGLSTATVQTKDKQVTEEFDLSEWASPKLPAIDFSLTPIRRLTQRFAEQEEEKVQEDKDLTPQQHLQEGEEEEDVDDMISRPSPSPPPSSMFELLDDEYYIGGGRKSGMGFTPWLMHFDSAEDMASNSPEQRLSLVPYLRTADLDTTMSLIQQTQQQQQQPPVSLTPTGIDLRRGVRPNLSDCMDDQPFGDDRMDVEVDLEGDDPFGFLKAERRLSRRLSRPKLLAINERLGMRISSPLRNLRSDSIDSRDSIFRSEPLEKGVLERAAARRRGGGGAIVQSLAKDKGKTAMRGSALNEEVETTASVKDSVGVEPSAAEAANIEKAIRLSLNDLAGFEKVGESSSMSNPAAAYATSTVGGSSSLVEEVAVAKGKDAETATPRSNRRISRFYGRSHLTAEPATDTATTTTVAAATASRARDDILQLDDLLSPPSTPPRRSMADRLDRSSSDLFRHSIGSDGLSPIVLATTPTKKPEAGMPSSYDSLDSYGEGQGRRSKPRKFMRTELLQAMLPRPRKVRGVAAEKAEHRGLRSKSMARDGDNVFVIDSDDSEEESELVGEEEEEEEEEVLVRRRHTRSVTIPANAAMAAATMTTPPQSAKKTAPTTKSTKTTANTSQKRQAPASTTTSVQQQAFKRQKFQKPSPAPAPSASSSTSKSTKKKASDKEDEKAHWTKEQRKAHEERIRYFAQIDDFELEVETA
ncbi:hypothetical protein BGX24_009664 [Mortierella sp. AD032]|nr:hypothetical protein BGX24_009664 [Mortierella sp. AD032]